MKASSSGSRTRPRQAVPVRQLLVIGTQRL
eukprot:COSAG06_NODE_24602_length_657_cov_3.198925_2_plen_29_part_01